MVEECDLIYLIFLFIFIYFFIAYTERKSSKNHFDLMGRAKLMPNWRLGYTAFSKINS